MSVDNNILDALIITIIIPLHSYHVPNPEPASLLAPSIRIPGVDCALLLASLPNLSAPHFLTPIITHAAVHTRSRLVIILFSRFFSVPRSASLAPSTPAEISHTEWWDNVQRLLTFVYVTTTRVAQEHGKILMDVDVLLKGLNEDLDDRLGVGMDLVYRVSGDCCPVPLPKSAIHLRQSYLPAGELHPDLNPPQPGSYPVVALGGTFDHLHAGHKILLSMAAWITSEKMIVGMTDDALLQNKSNKHVLEKLPVRTARVRGFLEFFKPGITYDIVPINDVYGPTGWDPNIQALVVSKETLSGAAAIAEHRAKNSLPPLQTFIIDVISSTDANLDHEDAEWLKSAKLSSTFIRQWIVDRAKEEEEEDE
ncbi:Nucleotidylyl transferase [Cyathus striatus]|nr:Nucleotidylyl transferase [Cyathus striatus]